MPRGEWSSNQLPATNRCARKQTRGKRKVRNTSNGSLNGRVCEETDTGKRKFRKHFQWKLEWKGARLICHEENGVRINCLQQIGVRGNRHGEEKSSKHFQWKLEWKGARLICHKENGVRINCLQQIGVRGNRHGEREKSSKHFQWKLEWKRCAFNMSRGEWSSNQLPATNRCARKQTREREKFETLPMEA
ncbi:hypothetical protein TNCV_3360301 [Trichonephila clavipes]|nr:hypothetical protein TNCV_3360301 [Trichonephila clavipes]